MSRKLLILAGGALVGVGAVYGYRLLADRYATEGGPPDVLAAALVEASSVVADIRAGMAEREEQLRLALGLDAESGGARLDPQATRDLLDDPAGWRARQG
ncbi:MAG TPA: hypothetical protein PKI09_05900 [Dermatophilaceae bacterium]|jgi:hypothetical protein|nr:hypothetical protein [Dermatophilaceae bacterium]HPZ70189.1 hypothetical protein [Dermatophilaceae bacterium]HQD01146.1 hypothetical protein [Dermatophilaceae bacterium]